MSLQADSKPSAAERVLARLADVEFETLGIDEVALKLAEALTAAPEVQRARVLWTWIQEGPERPQAELQVFLAMPGESTRAVAPQPEFSVLGGPAGFGDLREFAERVSSLDGGPLFTGDPSPPTGRTKALSLRSRGRGLFLWCVVEWAPDAEVELESWRAWLPPLLRLLRPMMSELGSSDSRRAARALSQKLLKAQALGSSEDLGFLCAAWRDALAADWVFLWRFNEHSGERGRYELIARAPAKGREMDERWEREFEFLTDAEGPGLGHYCSRLARPEYIDDIVGWRGVLDGVEHKVVLAESLARLGCTCLYCVPLLPPTERAPGAGTFHDVLFAYYFQRGAARRMPPAALLDMGRESARFLKISQSTTRADIQEQLNELTRRYLVRRGRPAEVRREFLEELIGHIRNWMAVACVSIFIQDRFRDAVVCHASTGLARRGKDGVLRSMQPKELALATYASGEGYTGACYAESRMILHIAREAEHEPRFVEVRKQKSEPDLDLILMCPIPGPAPRPGEPARALGVIRCAEHESALSRCEDAPFTPVECDTIRFVAEQVGPVLLTLNQRVRREQEVTVIRHEIAVPLVMIRDTIEPFAAWSAERSVEGKKPPSLADSLYAGRDVAMAAGLAIHLAEQLDPVVEHGGLMLRPSRTMLEGDIVARIKDMLGHYAKFEREMRIRFGDGFRRIPALRVDRAAIERIFYNLIVNAVKYGKPGTEIVIEAQPPESNPSYYVFTVRNEGIGIEEEDRERVFLVGYRSEGATRLVNEGVGLGLPLARLAAEAHGGKLELRRLKDPTVLAIYLPKTLLD